MYKKEMLDVSEIYDILYRLGITAESSGFFHTAYAVRLAMQQPERMMYVTKWLYPDVAAFYNTNWRAVERNIRRIARVSWKNNPLLICEIGMHQQYSKPTPARFIGILAAYLTRNLEGIASCKSGEEQIQREKLAQTADEESPQK